MKYASKMLIDNLDLLYEHLEDEFEEFLKELMLDIGETFTPFELKILYIAYCHGYLKSKENLLNIIKTIH